MAPVNAPARARGSLTADEVVDAAVALLAADGHEAFTMRRLGAELGVNPMTVYLRFANKDDLLAAVADRLVASIDLPRPTGTLDDRVVVFAAALREHLAATRAVLGVVDIGPHLEPAMLEASEQGLGLMLEAGLDGPEAVAGFRALFWTAVGQSLADRMVRARHDVPMATLLDGSAAAAPTVRAHLDDFAPVDADAVFDQTIRSLFAGLVAASDHPAQEAP